MNQPLVFTIGDLVVQSRPHSMNPDSFKNVGRLHIIAGVTTGSCGIQYRTNKGAWYSRLDFELVEKSSPELLDILFAGIPVDDEAREDINGIYNDHAEWRDASEIAEFDPEFDI